MIDWQSEETHLLLNPRLPADERQQLERLAAEAPPLPAHVLLATSGTTGSLKLTALSKKALLASAAAVNRHLESTAKDVWCCVLPTFHVGGLGIYARAHLSGARVVALSWDPHGLSEGITLASLVPAQVRDLVQAGLTPPASLRAIVVGGGALSDDLYRDALEAGWPVLPSYGMTECCSQAATARPGSPELVLLDHFEARRWFLGVPRSSSEFLGNNATVPEEPEEPRGTEEPEQPRGTEEPEEPEEPTLAFRGESLLTGYLTEDGFVDPKVDGWFVTEDRGRVEGRILRIEGRTGDFVKIGGESTDLGRLDRILAEIAGAGAAVVAVPDDRLGHVIHLAVVSGEADRISAAFNARVVPFERARHVHRVAEIPRTGLGKLMRKRLLEQLPKVVE